ncbi:polysaccharide pyruvyl transferase family protein [Streptococcus parauberis]|uniref:polysaccharide pyruvyl transferase family protein n=1 Tax=Streptococcus parauberis TaxID=1348 RepID=UPI000789B0FB|nr:polysaccharide pyruvyl transferase family protein [Streptococcus parauberis]KYP20849.1 Polysaccharide pyruvyl transferase [Streptococcus parauberis]KYP21233.1 Polysaccharide pyruvyl transferase [Streptococcus parauberis]KYP22371.1 Polysaccharide pyruvyl transferase [Streptococcus parauberis]KYP24892.1 Polysaccharide pyruvyl transferase [Streptococcus parauberis]KYP25869.1 Polysaccharide pyruvyl transferase [Streptococcus parauberis]
MKCYVHGSFMNDNFGDFLLYDIIVDYLVKNYPEIDVFSSNVSPTYDSLQQVVRKEKNIVAREATIAILGGGGYFGQPGRAILDQQWNYKFLRNHGNVLLELVKLEIPYIIIGAGVGPISWSKGRKVAKEIFENANYVVVRDKESFDYCKNVLKVEREINVLPDLVMGCNIEKYIDHSLDIKLPSNKTNIAIHLTTKNKKNGKGIDLVLNDIKKYYLANKKNTHFNIICDQKSEKQVTRANEIANLFDQDDVTVFQYGGPYHLTTALSKMDLIITDKLHVGIVGTKLGKHVISVSSHVKIGRFYNQMNREKYSVRLKDIEKNHIFTLLEKYPWELNNINPMEEKAHGYYKIIDDFILTSKDN